VDCLAHARRKFFEANVSEKAMSEGTLSLFGKIYAVKKYFREHKLTGDEKLSLRLEQSIAALNAVNAWMLHQFAVIQLLIDPIRKAI
jgi:transposase